MTSCAREPAPAVVPPATPATPPPHHPPSTTTAAPRTPAPDAGPALPPDAAAATPAAVTAEPRDDDFVDVAVQLPHVVLDLRYATAHNFTKRQLYPVARCLLRRAVAARLAKVAARLAESERRLLLWDCYRPASIQQALWELVPDPRYVARPTFAADGTPLGGSRHSRGAAVDAALADSDGRPLPMPTDHDDFSAAAQPRRAHRAARGGAEARLLADAMTAEGFAPIASEWWHFDAEDAARYPFSDQPLTCTGPCAEPR